MQLHHADAVVTHTCNKKCEFCVDKFRNTSQKLVDPKRVEQYVKMLKKYLDVFGQVESGSPFEILLLGGEPTTAPKELLVELASIIRESGFSPLISTNGALVKKIEQILPTFDWAQITMDNADDLERWKGHDNVNAKWSARQGFDMDDLARFYELSKPYKRRSVSLHFNDKGKQLSKINLDLDWKPMSVYEVAFWNGIRIKRGISGISNDMVEPVVPKLYPNGNYNGDWRHENMVPYLGELE